MERLRDVSRLLRGSKPENVDLSMLLEVRDIVETQVVGMKSIKQQLQAQDREWLLSMIKSAIGDSQAFIDSAKEIEPGLDMKQLEDSIGNMPNDSGLDDIPTAQLVQMFRPEALDNSIEASEGLIDIIDRLFDSPAAADRPHRRLDEEDGFDFGQGDSNFFQPNFTPFSGDIKMRRKASQNAWKKVSDALHSDHLGDAHKEHHHRRLQVLQTQGKCLPECSIDDEVCNCGKVAVAVGLMTEYDLGVLMLKGYIVSDVTSENFGNITHAPNLFNANKTLLEKYNKIQTLANEVSAEQTGSCVDLLEEFVTACNPEVQSCSNGNDQTYQLTVDEIVESVHTDIKLDLTVIYDFLDPERKLLGLDWGHLSCDVKCYFIYVLYLIAFASFNSCVFVKHSQRKWRLW